MATMIPDVPVTARPDAGEARVYLALKGLPDAYRIYHSVSYYVAPEGGRPLREGEIDFLILHPEKGLLVLEVKGGSIGYDGRERESEFDEAARLIHSHGAPMRLRTKFQDYLDVDGWCYWAMGDSGGPDDIINRTRPETRAAFHAAVNGERHTGRLPSL